MKNDTKLERAKIFLPFDALKGLKEALREKEKILVDKKILSIEEKEKISKKLIQIKKGMIIMLMFLLNISGNSSELSVTIGLIPIRCNA